jgi:hypothetical protein
MPKGRTRSAGPLQAVRAARRVAAHALEALRTEIASMTARLEELVGEEKSFLADLFPSAGVRARRRGRPATRPGRVQKHVRSQRGPAKADGFFAKLPQRFTLEAVREVAGRLSGVSLAQWTRAKKIAKTGTGYVKTGMASAAKSIRKTAGHPRAKKRRRGALRPEVKKPSPAATTRP